MTTTSTDMYNYAAFDFSQEQAEFTHWLRAGPAIGGDAPDFELTDLAGNTVRLSELRGRAVVLEFGSYTCPIFADRVPLMERLARQYPEATFLVIYTREAHPGEHQGPHHSLPEKRSAAHKLVLEEALTRPVLVDSLDGTVHRAYGGAWNAVYVIDPDGRVTMRQAWNHPQDVAAALDALRRGVRMEAPASIDMVREPGRSPMGQRLLERGGVRALGDFYCSAPATLREALRNSTSADVRAAIAQFDGQAVVTVTSADGTPIALWKTGSGPSLLVVHGTCADHSAWDKVVPLLAEDFTIYAMDRRGRGASGDAASYALQREVEDVLAAVQALPGPVYLFGHSFGGSCVVEAAMRTNRIDRLVLYEGGPKPSELRLVPDGFITRFEHLMAAGQPEQAVKMFMLHAAGVAPAELQVLRNHPSWSARVAAAHTIPRELRAMNDYAADMERVGTIRAPVLLVVGEMTDPNRKEMFESIATGFSNARVASLPGQRHAAHQTAPDLLADAIRQFLLQNLKGHAASERRRSQSG